VLPVVIPTNIHGLPRIEFEIFKFIEIVWFLVEYNRLMAEIAENYSRQIELASRLQW
jgi:hypothetical protein